MSRLPVLATLAAVLAGTSAVAGPSTHCLVSAAASLKPVLEDVKPRFESDHPGLALELNLGASGTLLAQIEQGAPVDLFIAASPAEADRAAKAGPPGPADRAALATNALVVVVPRGLAPPRSLAGLADPRFARIAVGNPATVPAGRYAEESLRAAGILDAVRPRLIFGEHARQVLDYVVRAEVDAGVVYRTDARDAGSRVVAGPEIDDRLHTPIVYEAVVLGGAPHVEAARAFVAFLRSPAGREAFGRHGFGPPPR